MPLWFFVGRGDSAEVFQAGLEIFHERLRLLGARLLEPIMNRHVGRYAVSRTAKDEGAAQ